VAAIPGPRRRRNDPPAWAGWIGMALGGTLGAAACYALATLL
jgi:hypothetical protein